VLPTATAVDPLPEHNSVQVERVLNDPRGGDARAQDVLLAGQVVGLGDPAEVTQEAVRERRRGG
jgi:hypothetical protein